MRQINLYRCSRRKKRQCKHKNTCTYPVNAKQTIIITPFKKKKQWEDFPKNITCWGAVIFEKWSKQCHENNFQPLYMCIAEQSATQNF